MALRRSSDRTTVFLRRQQLTNVKRCHCFIPHEARNEERFASIWEREQISIEIVPETSMVLLQRIS